jgi:hypothetical protein
VAIALNGQTPDVHLDRSWHEPRHHRRPSRADM